MNTRKNKNAKFSTGFKIVLSGGMLALGVALLYAQEPIQEPARGPQFWKFTGWACLPDMGKKLMGENPLHRDCEPREYFFLSVKARASQRAVEKGNVQMMRSTCRAAARVRDNLSHRRATEPRRGYEKTTTDIDGAGRRPVLGLRFDRQEAR